ncbi:MAG: FAD-dependent oxidoreductase, partial [Balneolaceae bacterium]
ALGYITSLSKKTFVVGSTYEHSFEHSGIDEKGLSYLVQRFEKVLPALKGRYKVLSQWSGVRASTPNRKPIMGKLKDLDNAFIFSGLGSKGLLYSGYLSFLMSQYLIDGTPLDKELDIQRLEA